MQVGFIDQPTTPLENRSTTETRYALPGPDVGDLGYLDFIKAADGECPLRFGFFRDQWMARDYPGHILQPLDLMIFHQSDNLIPSQVSSASCRSRNTVG